MRDRLEIIHRLMAPAGTLFIHIDDNELAYLTVLTDEIFGRTNRINIATFKQGAATGHKSINPGLVSTSNFILVYAKDKATWKPKRVFKARFERDKRYGQFIENVTAPFAEWRFCTLMHAFAKSQGVPETTNASSVVRLARPDYKAVSTAAREKIDESRDAPSQIFRLERTDKSDMYFHKGERILFYSDKLKLVDGEYVAGEPLTSIWDDLLSNNLHNEGGVNFPKGKKPEALIKRCLDLSTEHGDIVLDSFAGSGTTGAVAQKMGRRWIMIELREQADTHILPRMRRVVDGQDLSGVTSAMKWRGGGGFRYYELAPSLLQKDKWGREIISHEYDAAMLTQALCKLEGFTYAPSVDVWWQQGYSSETDFLYVTTQTLGPEELATLSDDVGEGRSLLVLCAAWRGNADHFTNLTLRKIPSHIRSKCEWGHDDYSLNVANLPTTESDPVTPPPAQRSLFDGESDA
jgi:adenine-specific DNA-methyltransferase